MAMKPSPPGWDGRPAGGAHAGNAHQARPAGRQIPPRWPWPCGRWTPTAPVMLLKKFTMRVPGLVARGLVFSEVRGAAELRLQKAALQRYVVRPSGNAWPWPAGTAAIGIQQPGQRPQHWCRRNHERSGRRRSIASMISVESCGMSPSGVSSTGVTQPDHGRMRAWEVRMRGIEPHGTAHPS